jgi:hypothetical protein
MRSTPAQSGDEAIADVELEGFRETFPSVEVSGDHRTGKSLRQVLALQGGVDGGEMETEQDDEQQGDRKGDTRGDR